MAREARLVRVNGLVQGVGFRPTVWRIAAALGLAGEVFNDPEGVGIFLEGDPRALDAFPDELRRGKPPLARIDSIDVKPAPVRGVDQFVITPSRAEGAVTTMITPDAATCPECLADIFDAKNRRYRYAFTNCTHCGPRFTITRKLPYDRPQTSMSVFPMCPKCLAEYENPGDRRFHAQPNACPVCGPQLELIRADGTPVSGDPVRETARVIREGGIAAVKGIGGFHLVCDASNAEAVRRLRERKGRNEKPLAVMCAGVASAKRIAEVNAAEETLLTGTAHPIVLLRKKRAFFDTSAFPGIADELSEIGMMLLYTPLHALLFHALLGEPEGAAWMEEPQDLYLVMTSANPGGEPLVIGNEEAKKRLASIADVILLHNREILIRCDDSVVRSSESGPVWVRRARGVTPEAIRIPEVKGAPDVAATGSYLKNTAAMTRGRELFLTQHIGDLDRVSNCLTLEAALEHIRSLLDVEPGAFASDLHPDFFSGELARKLSDRCQKPLIRIQHHAAHVGAAMAEAGRNERTLGAALDGVGLGSDGNVWGGELLLVGPDGFERFGSLRTLALPGGDRAAREPWRMGAAILAELGLEDARFELLDARRGHLPAIPEMMLREIPKLIHSPRTARTSALGRWFDGAAAILGLVFTMRDEATAAMRLESLAEPHIDEASPLEGGFSIEKGVLSFLPLMRRIVEARLADPSKEAAAKLAARFEATLAEGIARWIIDGRERSGLDGPVMLTGGCMLNRVLSSRIPKALRAAGIEPRIPHIVPPGDGGLALGQAHLARLALARGMSSYPFIRDHAGV